MLPNNLVIRTFTSEMEGLGMISSGLKGFKISSTFQERILISDWVEAGLLSWALLPASGTAYIFCIIVIN